MNLKNEYLNANKLHFLLDGTSSFKKLKDLFIKQFEEAIANEKEYCKKNKLESPMDNLTKHHVYQLIEQCQNFYDLEALARFIFDENYIPSFEQVKKRSNFFKQIYPQFLPFIK